MAVARAIFFLISLAYLFDEILGQSDLRSALLAIDRRQKELSDFEEKQQQYGYNPYEVPEDLEFLSSNSADGRGYGRDYFEDDAYEPLSKRFTSSFRERLEEDKEKQLEEFARNLYNNLENSGMPGGLDKNYLRELFERYYGNDVSYSSPPLSKKYYPPYSIESIGLRKRDQYLDTDPEAIYSIHHHVPREDVSDSQINILRNFYGYDNPHSQSRNNFGSSKRFLVAKRSSSFNKEQKRSTQLRTDPQVEKDLSNIFGNEGKVPDVDGNKLGEGSSTTTPASKDNKNEGIIPAKKIEKKDRPKMDANKEEDLNKEVFEPVAPQSKKQLQIKKKSIDWSDYFGLDRRKKSEDNGLDKEWLMERYHKAIAITAKKRNAELPMQSFQSHKSSGLKNDDSPRKEEQTISEMDKKLEKLEDEIVGDALKYTGAHQGEGDPQQQVKDNIISRLAQAYNVEKMRNALEEYKSEIEKARKEMEKYKTEDKFSDYTLEEKRVAVPRKEALDDTRNNDDGDNNIKCTDSKDCHEQNYKMPPDILEKHFFNLECPAVQNACKDLSFLLGHYGLVFQPACNIHQMCLLCSNNSWFSPTRQCNMLFLTKAFELCSDQEECKEAAKKSLAYLLDINKSLQVQMVLKDECELQCPDADILSK